ncbi:GtrA family protein [Leptotrichia sp. OH3620_COT-345]|uniref:GtrA family protein n=1 Tax=Leptotrichia sp. OH3620_COT-345 TaxID=2491048 RepID=UPI000F655A91|nr:GtrA family protein [Leptotrichia sp. OH3620_COT-345]RRD40760.1 GtrA family protein [Leptotrichia sp. OH3620_COT-345]
MKKIKKVDKFEILKFLIGGGSAVLIDFIVYKLLMNLGIERTFSKTVSFICGSIIGFIINKYWTFKSSEFSVLEIMKYIILYTITAFANSQVNKYVIMNFKYELFAFLCATGISTILNFLGQKFLIFKHNKKGEKII